MVELVYPPLRKTPTGTSATKRILVASTEAIQPLPSLLKGYRKRLIKRWLPIRRRAFDDSFISDDEVMAAF